uniref:L1 transposable element RRM domain-containing protein n=1 Tax=Cyprinus carpio TaxID=7962 RepID=A0A8C2ER77_CYPCA
NLNQYILCKISSYFLFGLLFNTLALKFFIQPHIFCCLDYTIDAMDESQISLQTLWNAITQSKTDMLAHFDVKMDVIHSRLTSIQNSLSTLGDQVNLLEQRVGANEDNVQVCVARIQQMEKDNFYLLDKVDDLENRSRRSNLRFVGVRESSEGSDIAGFMSRLIPQLLGQDNFSTPLIIEWAHRSPTVRQSDRASPRPIMIKLLNFQDKVKILRIAREKKKLEYNGTRIYIYPDFSADLMKKRRSFDSVKRKLRELDMKYYLRYPCTLCVFVDGKQQRFSCHKDTVFDLYYLVHSLECPGTWSLGQLG